MKSTILLVFFRYLAQIIISIRGCVACNDLWPWSIFSRSFGLENRVHSVASIVLDGFFPYLIQMITSMRRCVACDDLWHWPISSRSFDLVLTWDPTWLNSVVMRRRGVSSERRRSSCSSFFLFLQARMLSTKSICGMINKNNNHWVAMVGIISFFYWVFS